jgi:hypothetical protein
MFVAMVCPTEGLVAMRAFDNAVVRSLLVVFQCAL